MKDIVDWIKENSNLIEGDSIEIRDKRKSYDFRQLAYDAVIITMVSLTLKALIALSNGIEYINLY